MIREMTARELEEDCPAYISLKTGEVKEDENGYIRI
jgi:hypothetical protein